MTRGHKAILTTRDVAHRALGVGRARIIPGRLERLEVIGPAGGVVDAGGYVTKGPRAKARRGDTNHDDT